MTAEEKITQKDFHVRGGYLKKFTWAEAWANYWRDTSDQDRKRVMALPNFDAGIFFEITGIDVRKKEVTCEGKTVEIDGRKYKLVAA